jgi:hypothetical protein
MCVENTLASRDSSIGQAPAAKRWSESRYLGRKASVALRLLCLPLIVSLSGCSVFEMFKPISAVPIKRVPRSMLGRPRSDMVQISLARLRQVPPKVYQLGPNDVLGIYIENVLGQPDEQPPVNFPEDQSKPPSIGFPIPIREDGTIALPLIEPLELSGLTLEQATEEIRAAYTINNKILPEGKDRIIVTLQRPRMERIMVIREEGNAQGAAATTIGGPNFGGLTKHGTGDNIDLPAYENDLLHVLNETGGLPGLDAENDILIIRGGFQDYRQRELLMAQMAACRNPCDCPPQMPDDPNVTRIPIRYYPENPPTFTEEQIILRTGDIVMVQSRDREQYYTGGVVQGGAHLIPRDYDVDVLQAIAISGGSFGAGAGLARAGIGGGGGTNTSLPIPPSRAIVVRKTCTGQTIAIKINLKAAVTDTTQRILIQPEDLIIVEYTCAEQIANYLLRSFQINYLLSSGGLR